MPKKAFLFGNEAIVQGALESGIGFASTYPGTPASEIGDAFSKKNIYFEYSVNEKVALEAAAGAAFSGIKSLVSMKHYGLNVASDSLLPLVYLECPLVIVVADDPNCFSSVQTEQDSRWYSRLGKIPTLEPSDSQECKDLTKLAFKLSQKYKIPILIRLTTRVSYTRSLVTLNKIPKPTLKGKFIKNPFKINTTVKLHKKLLKKLKTIQKELNNYNKIENSNNNIGIITTGISYNYVKEAFQELNIKLPILKITTSYPFPQKKVKEFTKNLKKILIVEELDPIIENEVKKISKIKVYGKDLLPQTGEYTPEIVLRAISKILNKPLPQELKIPKIKKRIPTFCPGCPHRVTFYAVEKTLGKKKIFAGDIGCYMLGSYLKMQDFIVSMGASIGISHGISKTTNQKPIIFIGDSTFFHAGIPALINLTHNKANALVLILDNNTTAMTGQQPHPGSTEKQISLEQIAKACKTNVITSNVYNYKKFIQDIKKAYNQKGVSVIIAKGECRLLTIRKMLRNNIKIPKFKIIKQSRKLSEFKCPAIIKKQNKYIIDKNLCWGCSICKQIFPNLII